MSSPWPARGPLWLGPSSVSTDLRGPCPRALVPASDAARSGERCEVLVRSLLVTDNVPWPPVGGGLVRMAQVVEAVASISDLDLFVLHNQSRSKFAIPAAIPVARSKGVQNPRTASPLRWRLDWALRRGLPVEVAMPRADRAPRLALHQWVRPPYDVVWFSTARSYEWLGRPELGPTIVDLDNLEDEKCRLRAALLRDQMRFSGQRASLRSRLAWHQVRLNGSDWRRFQQSVAAQVERVVIASDLDAARSGLSNVAVIPNIYPRPAETAWRPGGRRAAHRALPGSSRISAKHRRSAVAGDDHRPTDPGGSPGDRGEVGGPSRHECDTAPSTWRGHCGWRGSLHGR